MNARTPFAPAGLALAAALALATGVARAHCGPNDSCKVDYCHHGPDAPGCPESRAAAQAAERIQSPQVQQDLREIVIPKLPVLKLPARGEKPRAPDAPRPPNLPAPPGALDPHIPQAGSLRPLPPGLPPSVIAREVLPQVYAGTVTATRQMDHLRAVAELRGKDPRLAGSAWLLERHQIQLGDAFRQLQQVNARALQAKEALAEQPRLRELNDSFSRATRLLQSLGSDGGGATPENK